MLLALLYPKRFTNWIPIVVYSYSNDKYLLMGRRDLKTGELYFKNKIVNGKYTLMHEELPNNLKPAQQLDILFNCVSTFYKSPL